jgi:thiol-disulfide isomerase/thioredoxin
MHIQHPENGGHNSLPAYPAYAGYETTSCGLAAGATSSVARTLRNVLAGSLLLILAANSFAGVKAGESFPDLSAFKLEGTLPETAKAKVVMVDFWASWCEPCKQSFPVMQDLHQRYAKEGLVIIAVNVDENRADMEKFLKKNGVTFAVLRDANQKLVERAGVATMPTSFLIDREGKVRFMHNGFRGAETGKKYDEEIQSLLK